MDFTTSLLVGFVVGAIITLLVRIAKNSKIKPAMAAEKTNPTRCNFSF